MSNYGGSYVKNFSEDANLFFGFQAKDGGKFESDFNQGALSKTVGGEVDLGNKYDSFVLGGKYKNTNYLLAAYQDKNYGIAMVSDVDSNGGMDHNTILAHIDHTFKYNKADLKIYSDYNLYYLQFTAENQFNGVGQPKVAKIVKFPNKEENYRSRVGMTFDYKASKYLNLFFGHEYEHRSHGDYTMINSDSGDILGNVLPKNSIYESAFFFQGDYFYEDWRFLLGARRTENELTGDKTTPRASVIYKISEYSSLKMLYAVGFNSPNAIQQRMAFTNVVVGNPDLRSETTKTIDLAYTYSRDHLLFVGNIFQLITNDQIMRGVPESGGALTYRNEDQFMRHGFELDFQKAWSSSKLFVNFAYLHEGNQDKSDDITLEFSSKYSSSIGYLYKLNDNHSVGGTYYYRSPRSNTDLKEEVAANNLLNLNYEYTKSNYKIFATISNFFDQEIREPNHAVSSGGQILQIRPGQTIESGVKFQF
jgi:outer membrane receptor for ferrienterochelin and colicin